MAELRTWTHRHAHRAGWNNSHPEHPAGWLPLGIRRLDCGCLMDDYTGDPSSIWEPCMAHEGDGHLSVLSEQDGMHVARCLVLVCPWQEAWFIEADAIGAAQRHWRDTRTQPESVAAGSN